MLNWSSMPLVMAIAATVAIADDQSNRLTHGPILGRPAADSMGVWVRTERAGEFNVEYGLGPDSLDQRSVTVRTLISADNTGWVRLEGLSPDTRYHYRAVVDGQQGENAIGSFRTLPDGRAATSAEFNPRGLFNFAFEFGCCNQQSPRTTPRHEQPVFDTALRTHGDRIHFAIQNGDWCYEERRDYPLTDWLTQVGLTVELTPEPAKTIPLVVGAWENYKLYLQRGGALRRWHRNVPSLFTFDDHEILDDAAGAGAVGERPRRALYRDIGVRAWYDYLGWANPIDGRHDIRFGMADLEAKGEILTDLEADFSTLTPAEQAELHIHWGGPNATKKEKSFDAEGGEPNAGVYEVVRVVDSHHLEIRPPARADGRASYSIGRFSYFKQSISNCDFFYLDTRGHRDISQDGDPKKPGISLLGARQKAWLKREMAASPADCFFVVSTVNFMIPHVVDVNEAGFTNHIDSWPAYWQEREELVEFFDSLGKKVFILTGDLHNSFAIQVTYDIWEFASAPHSSGNASFRSEGSRPPNGVYDSFGRECFIRWSTWFGERRVPTELAKKVYCIVNVNNVFRDVDAAGQPRWRAFPHPQIVFQYHDGLTGELLYSEGLILNTSWRPPGAAKD